MVIGRAAPGDQRLRGRVGIITGAASGIGAAGADLFAAHGAALVLLDQDPAGVDDVIAYTIVSGVQRNPVRGPVLMMDLLRVACG